MRINHYQKGDSSNQGKHYTTERIQNEAHIPAAAHLTCVEATREQVDEVARHYWEEGVRHIVALRGDPPDGASKYTPHPGGYANAVELIAGLKKVADFEISVSAYPEMHPDAKSQQEEIDYLKRKIDAGADRAITQFFFSPNTFFDYLEKTDKAGIDVPIVPGVLPITNVAKANNFI